MLFNSIEFIFAFLPITLALFWVTLRLGNRPAAIWLLVASLFFYGWWSPRHVVAPARVDCVQLWRGVALGRTRSPGGRRLLLTFGVAADLGLLAFFKYADFLLSTRRAAAGDRTGAAGIVLPIGISFYTFTQIAFLVDA